MHPTNNEPTQQSNKTAHTILYTACDEVYLRRFGIAFSMAAAKQGWPVHISAIKEDNQEKLIGLLSLIKHSFKKVSRDQVELTWSIDQPWRSWTNEEERRAILASNRFFTAAMHLHELKKPLLIADTDALVTKPPQDAPPADKVGIFVRDAGLDPTNADWIKLGTAVNAGLVNIPDNAAGQAFLNAIKDQIEQQNLEWYSDQASIYICYTRAKEKEDIFMLNENHLGWEDNSWKRSLLWSAKGSRKEENNTFKKRQKRLLRLFSKALAD